MEASVAWATEDSGAWRSVHLGLLSGFHGIGHAENGILELRPQLGIPGVGSVVFIVARAGHHGSRLLPMLDRTKRASWSLTILFVAVLTKIHAGWLLVTGTLDWVLILIGCTGLEAETKAARKPDSIPFIKTKSTSSDLENDSFRVVSLHQPLLIGGKIESPSYAD